MGTVRNARHAAIDEPAAAVATAVVAPAFSLQSISAPPRWIPVAACLLAAFLLAYVQAAVAQTFSSPLSSTLPPSAAMPYDAALAQYRGGEAARALETIDAALAQDARDLRLRFLRAVVLAELGRDDAAIEAFRTMAQEFPELPEPHNNLAVLLAARGELDAAHQALQDALRAAPGYSLAHENLGDLHLRLALRAYEAARTEDPGNRSAVAKLGFAREVIDRVTAVTGAGSSRPVPASSRPDSLPTRRP
jgi:tetratricopeptide (TPR) repeat protein